ncbi:MAG: MBL fold metallo-hydrolase [Bdellovibrionales bacterium]|nr:MBL fold metallo-hydrolase [Bdellovibrionales bacterium]
MKRLRRFLSLGLIPIATIACATGHPIPAPTSNSLPGASVTTTQSGIRIYALRTGFVGVKKTHRELNVPDFLAVPTIFLQWTWAAWMPVISYVIVHPEGTFVVDTGVPEEINDENYYDCDQYNKVFYKRNMSFSIPASDVFRTRLKQIGIDPALVKKVLITHFHADHTGGIADLPQAEIITGAGNWPKHVGSFTCRLPSGFSPKQVEYVDGAFGQFDKSKTLTSDGKVRIVPLIGHTPGHAGLAINDGGVTFLLAGDATFDQDQTERGAVCGVSEALNDARDTQRLMKQQGVRFNTVLLPAHDPAVLKTILNPIENSN